VGDANAQRRLPVFMVKGDDLAHAAADPAQCRATGDFQLRKQFWISSAGDLLADAVVVGPSMTMSHPASKPWARPPA
jgi:hypothetical protein